MKRLLLTLLLIMPLLCVAETPVERAMARAKAAKSITADFTVADGNATEHGRITISGAMFKMESAGMTVYFDGTTQATFVPADGEVTLTTPTADEVAQLNPLATLSTLSSTFNVKAKSSTTYVLTPKRPDATDLESIALTFSGNVVWPVSVTVRAGGQSVTITNIKVTEGVKSIPAKTFRFTPPKGITTIDLR